MPGKRLSLKEMSEILPGGEEIETLKPLPGSVSIEEQKGKLLAQGWEEVVHKGKTIGYLHPNMQMSHPVYNLAQAMEVYRWMNEERYGLPQES